MFCRSAPHSDLEHVPPPDEDFGRENSLARLAEVVEKLEHERRMESDASVHLRKAHAVALEENLRARERLEQQLQAAVTELLVQKQAKQGVQDHLERQVQDLNALLAQANVQFAQEQQSSQVAAKAGAVLQEQLSASENKAAACMRELARMQAASTHLEQQLQTSQADVSQLKQAALALLNRVLARRPAAGVVSGLARSRPRSLSGSLRTETPTDSPRSRSPM
jgi:hypothetical protein